MLWVLVHPARGLRMLPPIPRQLFHLLGHFLLPALVPKSGHLLTQGFLVPGVVLKRLQSALSAVLKGESSGSFWFAHADA